jgi:type II secretory pathway predicted ATPase ExeA
MLLSRNNNHVFISGQTRSGKTYFAGRALAELPGPVVFINLQEEDLPARFLTINSEKIATDQLIGAVKDGLKIDLRLPFDQQKSNLVTAHIINSCMAAGFSEKRPVYIALDECHLLKDRGLEKAIEAATRGLKRGVRCVFITQRPALSSKTLYTQSSEQYIFYLASSEKEYLRNKGLDYDTCLDHWTRLGQHSYIYYDGFKLEGRRRING